MKTKSIAILLFLTAFFMTCQNSQNDKFENENFTITTNYCDSIILIQTKWEEKRSNFWLNRIIPQLENESGIEASCEKGFFGHTYKTDSIFHADIKNWSKYFNCE
ncbi:hypothetical protein K6119_09405 [Paracrocinitomix mangrovi]|uniref:hypothetical protein n=1 Tax=Paracrocinitomix mangrovi TaxID=2862509 RepID=UPI001C8DEE76|nr:hypothetical protein [Paracrocinitomix mangrovi]UKN03706.1 hypothetical protein K6119_09405 [Paracrocinitomix mangrovi]